MMPVLSTTGARLDELTERVISSKEAEWQTVCAPSRHREVLQRPAGMCKVRFSMVTFSGSLPSDGVSFGLPLAQTCNACGSTGGVSRVLHRLLRSLSEKPMGLGDPPILVAATGNDYRTTGFDPPAEWSFTVAVGSINSNLDRSSFSNYGTLGHSQYIMMPGGEESRRTPTEWIGEATQKCYGTSPAAAYASGILALYMADPAYSGQSRSSFLSQVLANCKPCKNQNATEHGLGYLPYM